MSSFTKKVSVIRNSVPGAISTQVGNLLEQAFPLIERYSERNWGALISSGAEIFVIIDDPTGSAIGLMIFLPVKNPDEPYHQQHVFETCRELAEKKGELFDYLRPMIDQYLKSTDWKKITQTEAQQWDQFFPRCKALENQTLL